MNTIAHINVSSRWSRFQVWCCIQNKIESLKDEDISDDNHINEYNTTYGNDVALTEDFLIRVYHLIEKSDKVYIYNYKRAVDIEDFMFCDNVMNFCKSRKISYQLQELDMTNYV